MSQATGATAEPWPYRCCFRTQGATTPRQHDARARAKAGRGSADEVCPGIRQLRNQRRRRRTEHPDGPAFPRQQGSVNLRLASLPAPLRRLCRAQGRAPCFARQAGEPRPAQGRRRAGPRFVRSLQDGQGARRTVSGSPPPAHPAWTRKAAMSWPRTRRPLDRQRSDEAPTSAPGVNQQGVAARADRTRS